MVMRSIRRPSGRWRQAPAQGTQTGGALRGASHAVGPDRPVAEPTDGRGPTGMAG